VDLRARDPAERPLRREVLERIGVDSTEAAPPRRARSTPRPEAALFVGREAELEALHVASDAARRGSIQIVRVEGESGMGKSALLDQFSRWSSAGVMDKVELGGRHTEQE